MNPISVKCPICLREPGEPCVAAGSRGFANGNAIERPHDKRREAAEKAKKEVVS